MNILYHKGTITYFVIRLAAVKQNNASKYPVLGPVASYIINTEWVLRVVTVPYVDE